MNTARFVALLLALSPLSSFAAAAEEQLPSELESNYVLSPKGCMGLNEDPKKDGFFIVLTFDDVWKVEGQKIIAGNVEKFLYAVTTCAQKVELEKCESRRGVFKLNQGTGIFSMPEATEFTCVTGK
jgi:hypothetical protein